MYMSIKEKNIRVDFESMQTYQFIIFTLLFFQGCALLTPKSDNTKNVTSLSKLKEKLGEATVWPLLNKIVFFKLKNDLKFFFNLQKAEEDDEKVRRGTALKRS